ncbi:MAG TPA: DUF1579 family protein [Phycisphaerae bacterium]|nr:DUF1579 family protein [Phycisphaerae bacterium]HNU45539.1 DUF1579 family protein [Phycisphaerae bacterium]
MRAWNTFWSGIVFVMAIACASALPAGQEGRSAQREPAEPAPSKPAPTASAQPAPPALAADEPPPPLKPLAWFVSPWNVVERHFTPDGRMLEVKGTEKIKWVLDKHAVQREYVTGTAPRQYQALGLLTYNELEQRFQGHWYDNTSATGPTAVYGTWDAQARTLTFAYESVGMDGATRRFQVVDRFVDDDQRVATTYLIQGAERTKQMEVLYKRAIPCPADQERIVPVDELLGGG